MFRTRPFLFVFVALLCCLPGAVAGAQAYTSVVIIGDSLTDTGNDATVSNAKYGPSAQVPGPATGYTNGRFTDGTDTVPSAKNYYGVWIEQLAAMLPNKPTINYSLNGGANYAYGFATTGTGTTNFTYGPGMALNFPVNNMGAQLSSYLATNPTITSKTLFVVWGGANDLIQATTATDIQNAAMREAGIVQALINAGATDFIVPNLPPLGLVPRFNGSTTTSVPATTAAAGFDQYLAAYLAAIPAANPTKTLHIYQLDTYTLFNTIVAAPSLRGFANVTASSSAALTGITTVNPDTYLFWDDLHPTTYGHNQLANAAFTLLGTPVTTTTTLSTSNAQPNPGKSFTLTAQVVSASGIPQGTVTFLEGSTVLGSAYVTGGSTTGTATLATSYPNAGTHTITATFTGANGYASSATTTATSVLVVAANLQSTLNTPSIATPAGSFAVGSLTLTPQGGYTGTATVACGSLPAHFNCTITPASFTLSGNNTPVTANFAFGTSASASLRAPAGLHGGGEQEIVLACGILPGFGLLGLAALRRRRGHTRGIVLTAGFILLAGAASLGMTGCANNISNGYATRGTYSVPLIVTSNGTSTTLNVSVTVQ